MVKWLEKQRKICNFLNQSLVFVQIILIFIIFIVSLYWFLELIGNDMLSFMDSIITSIKSMMQYYFAEDLKKGQAGLDGSLFVFITLLGIVLYVIAQVKAFLKCRIKVLDKQIVIKREEEEAKFNKELKADAKRQIMKYKNVVLLIHINLKTLLRDVYQTHNDVKHVDKKQEEIVIVALFNMLKKLPNCSFAKDGRVLIVSSKDVEVVDTILLTVTTAIETLKAQLKPRKLTLSYNIAVDVFPDTVQLKDVYADLKTLLQLNMPNEILCYGNFCNRYEHIKSPQFEAYLKGTYDITDDENVWSLVKKS